MGIMSVLAEMHATPDFKLNLKFEIEVLCRQLQIQLSVSVIGYKSMLEFSTILCILFFIFWLVRV